MPEPDLEGLFAEALTYVEQRPMPSKAFEDTLGRRIKAARMQRGVKQAELARVLGISANAMVDIEKGRSYPRADRLRSIAQALSVSADYLLGLKEEVRIES